MTAREIFADALKLSNFALYEVEIQCIDKLVGGVPKDPDTIKKWLAARMEMGEANLIELAEETIAMMLDANKAEPTTDEILDVLVSKVGSGNGFKSNPNIANGQLLFEGRCLKSMLKEACNVAYPGIEFPGKPVGLKKGLMRAMNERVFVEELYIPLGVWEPDIPNEQRIKHIMTPQGPRSAINVVDIVTNPNLVFHVRVQDDFMTRETWARVWEIAENIGIGADRARSDGRFELVRFDLIEAAGVQKKTAPATATRTVKKAS